MATHAAQLALANPGQTCSGARRVAGLRVQTHMPPELLTRGTLSKAADSYAFGTILW